MLKTASAVARETYRT